MQAFSKSKSGFTVVELLVVIAVIGILAAITIIGYGAWQKSIAQNSVKSDLSAIAGAMESEQNFGTTYPIVIPSTYKKSNNVATPTLSVSASRDFYCVTATSATDPTVAFSITSTNKEPRTLDCATYTDVTVGRGLVTWLKMNNDAVDSSATNPVGTLTSVTATTGQNGLANNAYSFNGTTSALTSTIPVLGTNNVTISTWVNSSTSTNKGIFVKVGSAGSGIGYGIGMGNTNFGDVGNKLIMLFENIRWIPTTTVLPTGWHHVVMRIDADGKPSAFLDGVAVPGEYGGTGAIAPDAFIAVGGYSGTTRHFPGSIDDTRVYNRALSSADISALYAAGAR